MLKRLLLLLISVLFIHVTLSAQMAQEGRVVIQNSSKQPLGGVQVEVMRATPTASDNRGDFRLLFEDSFGGKMVVVDRVSKPSYMVVNQKELDYWNYSSDVIFEIVMSKREDFDNSVRAYYNIGQNRYRQLYENTVSQLEKERENKRISDSLYYARKSKASDVYNKQLDKLDEYADLFARVNKDDLHGIDSTAMVCVDKGDLDSAITIYEDAKLFEKFTKSVDMHQKLDAKIASTIPSLQRYADMCKFAGGEENL